MCDTWLTSYTISLLINVEFRSIEELNVLSYFFSPRFLSMFVYQILSRTDTLWDGNGLLVVVTWPVDFFHGSQYTYYLWLGLSHKDISVFVSFTMLR